ncbi:MAG: ABC transporter ATP-binding protein [Syntrophales bacterium]|nr:ABC transporter ATP-binding protein [Syntrophales bacterium]
MRDEVVVAFENVSKVFGKTIAVDGVTFTVSKGECFGILGPNGAGKTSTIRMIYGLSPLSGGSLKVFGMDVTRDIRSVKRRLGVCQQETTLDPDLTVLDNLIVFARYFGIPKRDAVPRAEELLHFMGLESKSHVKVGELSGGMIRRLMLARALINDPELLILDEPTIGLDPQSRNQVWDKLMDLRLNGLTILLTTHYMEEAAKLCDRIIIMDRGKILVEGSPELLVKEYIGTHVLEITDAPYVLRDYLHHSSVPYEEFGHRLVVYGKNLERIYGEISGIVRGNGCVLRMANLEDVFLKMTGRSLKD